MPSLKKNRFSCLKSDFCSNQGFIQDKSLVHLVFFADFRVEFFENFGIRLQKFHGLISALSDLFVVVAEPASALLHESVFNRQIQNASHVGNARAVHDVELRDFERRRDFVLDDFCFDVVANDVAAVFERVRFPYFDTHGGIEF